MTDVAHRFVPSIQTSPSYVRRLVALSIASLLSVSASAQIPVDLLDRVPSSPRQGSNANVNQTQANILNDLRLQFFEYSQQDLAFQQTISNQLLSFQNDNNQSFDDLTFAFTGMISQAPQPLTINTVKQAYTLAGIATIVAITISFPALAAASACRSLIASS